MNQVPVETIGSVIKNVVKEVSGEEFSGIPSAQTVSQMAYELGVITDLPVWESLSFEEDMIIAWDATSLHNDHVNEVHIHFKDESCYSFSSTLGFDILHDMVWRRSTFFRI